jgi:hypothetical protein
MAGDVGQDDDSRCESLLETRKSDSSGAFFSSLLARIIREEVAFLN